MEKIVRFLPITLFTVLFIKGVTTQFLLLDTVIAVSLVALSAFFEYKIEQKQFIKLNEALEKNNKELEEIKTEYGRINNALFNAKLNVNYLNKK